MSKRNTPTPTPTPSSRVFNSCEDEYDFDAQLALGLPDRPTRNHTGQQSVPYEVTEKALRTAEPTGPGPMLSAILRQRDSDTNGQEGA
jgi:hypothetical protein